MSFEAALKDALGEYRASLDTKALARLQGHWSLLQQWSARLNLTSIYDPADAAWRHYRDSLEPLRVLGDGPWVDMGSGAGFPGVPLAIMRPSISITLIEPRRKRVSFLKTVVAELELDNLTVHQGRSTDAPLDAFGAVVTRATFSQSEDLEALRGWCRPGGLVVALRKEASGVGGSRLYSYSLRGDRRVMEVWTRR